MSLLIYFLKMSIIYVYIEVFPRLRFGATGDFFICRILQIILSVNLQRGVTQYYQYPYCSQLLHHEDSLSSVVTLDLLLPVESSLFVIATEENVNISVKMIIKTARQA